MKLNLKKFLQGAILAVLVISFSWLVWRPIKAADYPWDCIQDEGAKGVHFTNDTDQDQMVRCLEFYGCECPGWPAGQCGWSPSPEQQEKIKYKTILQRFYAPGESGFCGHDLSLETGRCGVYQLDLFVEEGGDTPPNCSFILSKCDNCGGVTPTPTPTSPLTPTPTPTPTTAISSTPTPTLPVSPSPTPTPRLTCQSTCSSDSDCAGDLRCQDISGTKRCVNTQCPTEGDCVCNKNCWDSCSYTSECPQNYVCQDTDGTWRCVHPDCNKEQDCECNQPEVLGIEAPKVLPKAGFALNSLFLAGVIIFALRYLLLKV